MKKKTKPQKRKSALAAISALFVISVGLRIAGGTGDALARQFDVFNEEPPLYSAMIDECHPEPGLAETVAELTNRKTELDRRENKLREQLLFLEDAEREFKHNLQALAEAENALKATLALADSAAQADIDRLTAVYNQMKSKDAAEIFEQMDPKFAAGFIGQMKPDKAAEVLAGLSPERGYTVSLILAGRNAKAKLTP